MKAKLILLSLLITGFVVFVIGRYFLFSSTNDYGQLRVLSSPTASIFLNNLAIGKTPFTDKVRVGEYILKLIPEGTATDTASWQGKIEIFRNASTYVNQELGSSDINSAGEVLMIKKMDKPPDNNKTGEVLIETDPAGALIFLDNDEKGVAPAVIESVLGGDHELQVFLPGFIRRTVKINVDPGYRIIAKFKLAIDQLQQQNKLTDEEKQATDAAKLAVKGSVAIIKETPTGWLRVRTAHSIDASESEKIKPGQRYEIVEEQENWYKIKYNNKPEGLVEGEFEEGWVSAAYITKE